MKKKTVFLLTFFVLGLAFAKAQSQRARNYFDQGEFEKAILSYKKAVKQDPSNQNALAGLVKSYQATQQYEEAQASLLNARSKVRDQGFVIAELGYNYQLQHKDSLAQAHYNEAINLVALKETSPYQLGKFFQNKSLLEEAVKTYTTAMETNPRVNFELQLAKIYGELGEIEKMFSSYLDLVNKRTTYIGLAQRNFSQYITEDPFNEPNIIFRKLLLKRLQQDQNILYNQLLSWLFIQQKDYNKAFAQEKAIYNRTDGVIDGLLDLAIITQEERQYDIAKKVITYLKEETYDTAVQIEAEQRLLQIAIIEASTAEERLEIKSRFEAILADQDAQEDAIPLQIDYAHFIAFDMGKSIEAIDFLKKQLKLPHSRFGEARLKMELADVLVLEEKFNQALIYYSQVQNKIKNNVISQKARFKVAKTSYYKGDFKWAENQLNILKAGATQLIANDALELLLVIRDNSQDDSLQTALKKYAKADLLAYQNKKEDAIKAYAAILEQHKGEEIEDEAFLSQALLLEEKGSYKKAENNYLSIIDFYNDGILADDAHYRLALLYENKLDKPNKAKQHYERIIFDFADSIYLVQAQKSFRRLRGDQIN